VKIRVKLFAFCLGLLPVLPAAIHAQEGQSPAPFPVRVGWVTDSRSSDTDACCQVELIFTNDMALKAGRVRQAHVTEATDDLGRDLVVKAQADDGNFINILSLLKSLDAGGTLRTAGKPRADLKLRSPSRKANAIKLLKGEVEFFNPTETNGGRLTIPDVIQHPAEIIQNPALAKYGIRMMYVTLDAFDAEKADLEAQFDDDPTGQELKKSLIGFFTNSFGGTMISDPKNTIMIYVRDPDQRIVGLKFVDRQGQLLDYPNPGTSGDLKGLHLSMEQPTSNLWAIRLNSPPPPDTQLVVELVVPEALKTYPFTVENIALP